MFSLKLVVVPRAMFWLAGAVTPLPEAGSPLVGFVYVKVVVVGTLVTVKVPL